MRAMHAWPRHRRTLQCRKTYIDTGTVRTLARAKTARQQRSLQGCTSIYIDRVACVRDLLDASAFRLFVPDRALGIARLVLFVHVLLPLFVLLLLVDLANFQLHLRQLDVLDDRVV